MQKHKHVEKPTEQKAAVEEEKIDYSLKEFTSEEAIGLFKEYAKELAKQKRKGLAAFFADPLLKADGNTVTFTVGSNIVAQDIDEEKVRLKKYFASKGFQLESIKSKVNATEINEYKVFTPKQQFDALAKEYPILKDFESRFNLDIDA
ncbi:MAG: hypothetical protein KJP21_03245 [Bacteroidia bacterium]|nr:hypothetical protein [Bacteroidia bacterium]